MLRPRRCIVILALAFWLALLGPAWAAPPTVGSDPVYIGIWIEDIAIEFSYGGDDDGDTGSEPDRLSSSSNQIPTGVFQSGS